MKRLSVIVPGYNTRQNWWQRCIASLLNAIDDNDEIILVDDGSKNPVLMSWFPPDPRIRLIRRDNGGLAAARNSALDVAESQYVTFVDSDDEVRAESYSRTIAEMEKDGADIGFYGVRTVWVEERLAQDDSVPSRFYGVPQPKDVRMLSDTGMLNYACNKIYRRSFLSDLRFELTGMPCEDIIFNLACILRGSTWCGVDYVGYIYYRTRGTLLGSATARSTVGLGLGDAMWDRYKEAFPEAKTLLSDHGCGLKHYRHQSGIEVFMRKLMSRIVPLRRYKLQKHFRRAYRI